MVCAAVTTERYAAEADREPVRARARACRRRRIITAQCALIAAIGSKDVVTPSDFGLPKANEMADAQVFEGNLPSIKKSYGSIQAASPKKGANMHDTPPSPYA